MNKKRYNGFMWLLQARILARDLLALVGDRCILKLVREAPQGNLPGIRRKVWTMQPMRSLTMPLEPPVHLLRIDSLPKLVAGGVPVLPINLILARKRQFQFTPDTTLFSLVHAAQYYVEFCAHRGSGLLDVAHEEFTSFKNALLGEPFKDAEGHLVYLSGSRNRSRRRVDHILQLLYGIAADITEVYGETL